MTANADLRVGQKVFAFDKLDWVLSGRPEDTEPFWREARVVGIHEAHHYVPETVTLSWDSGGARNTSHGHRPEELRLHG